MDSKRGILLIEVSRGGSVDEILQFLIDIQNAYENLYALELKIDDAKKVLTETTKSPLAVKRGRPPGLSPTRRARDVVLPDERLIVYKIEIRSPGIWEFLASLSPLLQLREYAKDRHERRKDREWREVKVSSASISSNV